ncbi:MAG: TIGR01777 family oxidoreductase [Bacteroidota bacterium]
MAKILISGGSGLVGKKLTASLLNQKHEVVWLSRTEDLTAKVKKYKIDLNANYINKAAFENVTHIVHLAGAGIADRRWTDNYKKEIIDSRVKSLELIHNCIIHNQIPIKQLVGASAIGYYGGRQSKNLITETSEPHDDFLSQSCVEWENSYKPFINANIPTSIVRIGVVLDKDGGAYRKMATPFKLGFGCAIASGEQFFPWIHCADVVGIFEHLLFKNTSPGVFNAVSPGTITNSEFSKELAKSFHKKIWLPNVPKAILQLIMGEGAAMVTEGLAISSEKIRKDGYIFQYPNIQNAVANLNQHV